MVSDVHGNAEALARAGDGADALVVLGDLIDFVDYHEHGGGILGALFGADNVATFATLRREGRRQEMVELSKRLWGGLDDPRGALDEAVREQYARLFAALPAPTYAIPGNVDAPALWPEFEAPGLHFVDGQVCDIGGLRFAFIGGAVLPDGVTPRTDQAWRPYLRTREEYDKAAAALSGFDVLCSHIPPALPELTYDVVARRGELGSSALTELIVGEQPRWSLFGHVHQPLTHALRVGVTECRNVGHFQKTARPYVLRW
ncbi:calcineurin-like phosphoesterase family protein [Prauserella rugosa]|uniref:Calcineurin-like phosphoesterase family protein n=1 Tax=Prauserella rugosa TaxID=43354 RepID=A0A660CDI2_9PSEU|nr:Calcineurin-like phosphoesterase [Prauserella sp. Am3]TWH18981.1 calcineurin-like phosphoesterase family protein [Prauserella rugosa]